MSSYLLSWESSAPLAVSTHSQSTASPPLPPLSPNYRNGCALLSPFSRLKFSLSESCTPCCTVLLSQCVRTVQRGLHNSCTHRPPFANTHTHSSRPRKNFTGTTHQDSDSIWRRWWTRPDVLQKWQFLHGFLHNFSRTPSQRVSHLFARNFCTV